MIKIIGIIMIQYVNKNVINNDIDMNPIINSINKYKNAFKYFMLFSNNGYYINRN